MLSKSGYNFRLDFLVGFRVLLVDNILEFFLAPVLRSAGILVVFARIKVHAAFLGLPLNVQIVGKLALVSLAAAPCEFWSQKSDKSVNVT